MTENEVVEKLSELHDEIMDNPLSDKLYSSEFETLIFAEKTLDAFEELKQYRKIGTVEECREARERQKPKVNKWIPCSERLPEDGQKVLATHKGGLNPNLQVIEHVFRGGEFLDNWDMDTDFKSPTFGQRYMGDVIAWQPFPEPYHEDGGSK